MSNILVINSSSGDDSSVSRRLVGETVAYLTTLDPHAKVTSREIGHDPIPHLTASTLAGIVGDPVTEAEVETRALSDQLIAEVRAADTIVIGAPMYNFSIPTSLRSWFDHVLRKGETFSYSEAGPKGLLEGKRAIVIESSGGLYSEGPMQASDFQEPYLRQLLGFVGITDVTFIRAEMTGFGPDALGAAIESARRRIADLGSDTQAIAA